MNGFQAFLFYLNYGFVQRAIVAGILIALCASLLGVTLVLKRFSLIGDGLSHTAFGAMCIAAILHIGNDMVLILPVTIFSAILLLNGGEKLKMKGDAAIALLSVSSLAIGYLLMNVFSASANVSGDVCTTLFGSVSILTLTRSQVWMTVALSMLILVIYILFYNKIFVVTFDEDFAKATGVKVKIYKLLIGIVIAVTIVLSMKLVGSLLISALIIFPALSAMCLFKSYRGVIVFSAVFSVLCASIGLFIAIAAGTPVGSTIVLMNLIGFGLVCLIGRIR